MRAWTYACLRTCAGGQLWRIPPVSLLAGLALARLLSRIPADCVDRRRGGLQEDPRELRQEPADVLWLLKKQTHRENSSSNIDILISVTK